MEDVGLLFFEDAAQAFDLFERAEAFFVDGEGDVATTLGFELGDLASAIGNDDGFVPLIDELFAHFKSAAFDAACIQFWEDLDDFHGGIRDAGYGIRDTLARLY